MEPRSGLLVVDQFEFLSAPRMIGMSSAKSSFFTDTLLRSPRLDANGRHERMHRTLKQEAAQPPAAQPAQERFRREYHQVRPHEALQKQNTSGGLSAVDAYVSRARAGTGVPGDQAGT